MITSRPVVEVLGVAGAGKSTLVGLLVSGGAGIHRAEFIHSRRPLHLLYIVRSIPSLLPMLALNLLRPPRITWREFKLFVYVSQWRRLLRRDHPNGRLLLIDQGPMYCLVRLQALGKGVTKTPWFRSFRQEMARVWSKELSAVVFLDANDEALARRINERRQEHVTKNREADEVQAFLNHYRDLFGELVELLPTNGPQILRVDTSEVSPAEVAAKVTADLQAVLGDSNSVNSSGSTS